MIRAHGVSVSVLALVMALSGATAVQAADKVGEVSRLIPDATAIPAGEVTYRTLSVSDGVQYGDTLSTGSGAKLLVDLRDGSELTLGEDTVVILDDLVIQEEQTSGVMTVMSGVFLLAGGEQTKHENMVIKTPIATIGIRGTSVWGGEINGQFGVLLREGEVTVTTPRGSVVLDEPGEGTFISHSGAAPTAPDMWQPDTRDAAIATVTF
ncbi:MAG: FecR family protein [Rhodospirillaceae bacterium]